MKKYLSFLFLLLMSSIFITALNASDNYLERFNEAGKLYSSSKYEEAAKKYESLISEGQKNAALFYNLGNAYYKNGHIGKAILNYEKAFRLDKRSPDIQQNLDLLRAKIGESKPDFPRIIVVWLISLMTIDSLTAVTVAVYLVFILCLILHLFLRTRITFLLVFPLAAVIIITGSWWFLQFNEEILKRSAIVIVPNTNVRNGPGPGNTALFVLPEGRKVQIISTQDKWAAIRLPEENLKGWTERSNIEDISL